MGKRNCQKLPAVIDLKGDFSAVDENELKIDQIFLPEAEKLVIVAVLSTFISLSVQIVLKPVSSGQVIDLKFFLKK